MNRLDDALAKEQQELDTVLLRLTTLRLLLATGKHRLVDRAIAELQDAMVDFEAAEQHSVAVLHDGGHQTVADAAAALDDIDRDGLIRRSSDLRALHREVRVALASTATATERSLRQSVAALGLETKLGRARKSHPFFTETD